MKFDYKRNVEGLRDNPTMPRRGRRVIPMIALSRLKLYNKGRYLLADKPDITLMINLSDLDQMMIDAKTLDAQTAGRAAKIQGDASILKQLASTQGSRSFPAQRLVEPRW